tara:strand:+ start:1036 stop:2649 length:1614 start_codon:yes stop_codon:yes gene_type:complete
MKPSWKKLAQHAQHVASLPDLFRQQPDRFDTFSVQAGPLLLDYSKNNISAETLALLTALADECDLQTWRQRMFEGEKINTTEQRAVLHTALRHPNHPQVGAEVHRQLTKMEQLCEALHTGRWQGYNGAAIKDVVIIGIGGSYLGPQLVCDALRYSSLNAINIHFVANVDAHSLDQTLAQLTPESCLFVVISKSFTTQETLLNAHTALAWLQQACALESVAEQHFMAITACPHKAQDFGIHEDNILTMWDWVGGRYSVWSSVGLPIALSIGMPAFREFLAGAAAIDEHFRLAPLAHNLPVLMALVGLWNNNFLNYHQLAVLPYDQRLQHLPVYLQQLDMESNGKQVNRAGDTVSYATGPVVFGEVGTNGQHAFHQLLHQGRTIVACDFIAFAQPAHRFADHHETLLANMLAQSQALMSGRDQHQTLQLLLAQGMSEQHAQHLAAHMSFAGNRPSNTLLAERLDAHTLGALLAAYEHKVFVQGVLWDINSFDQMGVELGKTLSQPLLACLQQGTIDDAALDSSTAGLLRELLKRRKNKL